MLLTNNFQTFTSCSGWTFLLNVGSNISLREANKHPKSMLIVLQCVITHIQFMTWHPSCSSLKQTNDSSLIERWQNHQHLLSLAKQYAALFVPGSQCHIKWPDKGKPRATSDKVSGLWKLLTAQIQCNRRPKWPGNHIFTNLSHGQTNVRGVGMRQVAF